MQLYPPARKVLAKTGELLGGLMIFWVCLAVGTFLKSVLWLMVPGNVLGLFLLLGLISVGAVKLRYVELASKWLLFFMPLLFVPIYVSAAEDKTIWAKWGWLLVPALVLTVTAMWVFVGHLAQRLNRRSQETGHALSSVTETSK
ncbi:MAG TPA: CidA/LrgA family protein [Chthoniobacterales bacterium]